MMLRTGGKIHYGPKAADFILQLSNKTVQVIQLPQNTEKVVVQKVARKTRHDRNQAFATSTLLCTLAMKSIIRSRL